MILYQDAFLRKAIVECSRRLFELGKGIISPIMVVDPLGRAIVISIPKKYILSLLNEYKSKICIGCR